MAAESDPIRAEFWEMPLANQFDAIKLPWFFRSD
jgi:hypothetical protein